MLYARSATRWPARTLALASISVAAFLFAAGSANAVTTVKNTAPITMADASAAGVAGQTESDIGVTGVTGNVSKVTATLTGFKHTCQVDVDMLLVDPTGTKSSLLMSDAGDCSHTTTHQPLNLTFDDNGTPVPCVATSPQLLQGSTPANPYKPTDYSPATNGGTPGCQPNLDDDHNVGGTPGPLADVFTAPAPPKPWGTSLAAFNGGAANGTWRLLLVDQYNGDTGTVSGGWQLDFTIAPPTVGAPSITGPAQVGQLLTAVSGPTTGAGAPTYQWNHCSVTCTAIPGATGSTYVPQSSDANTAITVTEAVSNSSGAVATATSNPTATVAGGTVLPQQPNLAAVVSSRKTKSTQKVLRQGGVLAAFTSSASGNLVASGTLSVPNLAKTYRFTVVKSKVVAGNPTTVRLKLSSKALKAVKKALAKHKKLKAKITLLVTTPSGAKTTVHKTIKLSR
jgi:subtilisin-like proprotein convertase family protein